MSYERSLDIYLSVYQSVLQPMFCIELRVKRD